MQKKRQQNTFSKQPTKRSGIVLEYSSAGLRKMELEKTISTGLKECGFSEKDMQTSSVRSFLYAYSFQMVATLADVLSTYWALEKGATEVNPMVMYL